MKNFWNERYSQQEYAYGEVPNIYLKEKLSELSPGKILFAAEGEGRNAVYAALHGWNVVAFDISEEGKNKAEMLARKNNVEIQYDIADLSEYTYAEESFDALSLIYVHIPPSQRKSIHQQLIRSLKKGGTLIIEAFSKAHLNKQKENPAVGGPKDEKMLYETEDLKNDFADFEFIECDETETVLNEGHYHKGVASVIRIKAIKK